MHRVLPPIGVAWLAAGLMAGGLACNALVEGPDAFALVGKSTCDGTCVDAGGAESEPPAEAGPKEPRGPDPLSPWPMIGANAAHTARVSVKASTMSGKLAHWQVKPGVPPSAGPAVDGDGAAYFTTTTGKLISVALDGTVRWSRDLGAASRCTPALGNGAVYATSKKGLTAFAVDGTQKWNVPQGSASSPVVVDDGTILVTDVAGVHAVSPEGTVKWSYPSPGGTELRGDAVAVADDGVIYAVRTGLHAIAPNGVGLWIAPVGDLLAPPPVLADGKLFVGSGTDLVAVRTSDHGVAWKRSVTNRLRASPAIDTNGRLYYFSGTFLEWVEPVEGLGSPTQIEVGITRSFQPAVDGRNHAYLASRTDADLSSVVTFRNAIEQSDSWTLSQGDLEPLGFAFGRDGTVFYSASSPTNTEAGYVIAIRP